MKLGFLLFIFVWCFLNPLWAQNLIPNPSFEEKHGCPEITTHDYRRSLYFVQNWNNAHGGSCDYLHTCIPDENFKSGLLSFLEKMSPPRTGQGYIGMVTYTPDMFYGSYNYREIPLIKLTHPLEKEVEYELEFFVKLAPNSSFSISNFNVYFLRDTRELIKENNTHNVLVSSMKNEFRMLTYNQPISDTSLWTRITFLYIAQGGENYMIMGNLNSNEQTETSSIPLTIEEGQKPYCYYFVDDVWLSRKGQLLTEHNFEIGNTFILENIHFETGSSYFTENQIPELDKVCEILKEYPEYGINIIGYTDKEGDEIFNKQLSFDRAKNVRKYLEILGTAKSRMKIMGMGSLSPIGSNKSESGKEKNRRVEIEVIKSE